jgi:carboxyl-terminal processing protease
VRDAMRYVAASNDRLARTHVFSYPVLFPEIVSIGLQSGDVIAIDRSKPGDVAPPAPAVEGRWMEPGRIAYIRVPSFGDPANEQAAIDLVRQYSSASSMIVDVRGNGGGTTPRRLIDALMNRSWRFWRDSTGRDNPVQTPRPDAYQGSIMLLVDRFCGSACEDFVMPFKTTRRGTLIGETTQGSSGNPYRTDIGNGMRIAVGAVRYRFPDGRRFEGVGIDPDVPVERRIADIGAGRDAALARAEELAAGRR